MRAHSIHQPVMDGPDLQIDRFDAAKSPFHQGQGFIAAHRRRVVERVCGQAGAHDIEAVGCRFSGDLGNYIGQVFQSIAGQQARIGYVQPRGSTINGIDAAYSTARVATQSGQVDLTVVAYRWDSDTAYHFAMITPAGSGLGPFEAMVGSLTRIGAAEAAAIRPRVIDVVTVGPSDSVSTLAARMAYRDLKEERFRVLNGLAAGAALRPGQKVKIVVYGTRDPA